MPAIVVMAPAVGMAALRAITCCSNRWYCAKSFPGIGIRMNHHHSRLLYLYMLPFALGHDRIPRHLSLNVTQRPLACSQRHPELARHLQQYPVGGRAFFLRYLTTHDRYKFSYEREFAKVSGSRLSTVTVGFGQNSTGRWIQKRRQSDPYALTSAGLCSSSSFTSPSPGFACSSHLAYPFLTCSPSSSSRFTPCFLSPRAVAAAAQLPQRFPASLPRQQVSSRARRSTALC